jgi:hypothetical protein
MGTLFVKLSLIDPATQTIDVIPIGVEFSYNNHIAMVEAVKVMGHRVTYVHPDAVTAEIRAQIKSAFEGNGSTVDFSKLV